MNPVLILVPAAALIMGPRLWVSHVLKQHNRKEEDLPLTARELARELLDAHDLQRVKVESTDVDLGRLPPAPRPRERSDEAGVAHHHPLPVPEARMMATRVEVDADEIDVRHREDPPAHLGQVLGRDSGLVDLHAEVDQAAGQGGDLRILGVRFRGGRRAQDRDRTLAQSLQFAGGLAVAVEEEHRRRLGRGLLGGRLLFGGRRSRGLLVILDEATASVDSVTERLIDQAVTELLARLDDAAHSLDHPGNCGRAHLPEDRRARRCRFAVDERREALAVERERGGIVGEEGDGWRLAKVTLSNERVSLSSAGSLWGVGPSADDLIELAIVSDNVKKAKAILE